MTNSLAKATLFSPHHVDAFCGKGVGQGFRGCERGGLGRIVRRMPLARRCDERTPKQRFIGAPPWQTMRPVATDRKGV
jgi:hypothetical protein